MASFSRVVSDVPVSLGQPTEVSNAGTLNAAGAALQGLVNIFAPDPVDTDKVAAEAAARTVVGAQLQFEQDRASFSLEGQEGAPTAIPRDVPKGVQDMFSASAEEFTRVATAAEQGRIAARTAQARQLALIRRDFAKAAEQGFGAEYLAAFNKLSGTNLFDLGSNEAFEDTFAKQQQEALNELHKRMKESFVPVTGDPQKDAITYAQVEMEKRRLLVSTERLATNQNEAKLKWSEQGAGFIQKFSNDAFSVINQIQEAVDPQTKQQLFEEFKSSASTLDQYLTKLVNSGEASPQAVAEIRRMDALMGGDISRQYNDNISKSVEAMQEVITKGVLTTSAQNQLKRMNDKNEIELNNSLLVALDGREDLVGLVRERMRVADSDMFGLASRISSVIAGDIVKDTAGTNAAAEVLKIQQVRKEKGLPVEAKAIQGALKNFDAKVSGNNPKEKISSLQSINSDFVETIKEAGVSSRFVTTLEEEFNKSWDLIRDKTGGDPERMLKFVANKQGTVFIQPKDPTNREHVRVANEISRQAVGPVLSESVRVLSLFTDQNPVDIIGKQLKGLTIAKEEVTPETKPKAAPSEKVNRVLSLLQGADDTTLEDIAAFLEENR